MRQHVIREPETSIVEVEHSRIVMRAQEIQVRTKQEHELAQEFLVMIATASKQVEELFAESKSLAHQAHKAITAAEKRLLEPLGMARDIVEGRTVSYEEAEAARVAVEQARLEEEAKQREAAQALTLAMSNEESISLTDIEQEVEIPFVHVAARTAMVKGVSTKVTYRAEVVSFYELVKYVAQHPELLSLLEPNQPALNSLAKSMRDGFTLPGCVVKVDQSKTVRVR